MRDPNSDSDKSHNEQQRPTQPPRLGILEYEASDDVKRWARRYRTELASMSSSVLSTFIAVCLLGRLGHWPSGLLMLPMLTVLVQFPLDFAKTRMQSWVDIDNNLRTTAYPIPSYDTRFIATVKDAYQVEGLRGFWRGMYKVRPALLGH
ncbi:unnamed protein product [Aureobasidium pullulans]|nr:unnamed protein product [Aureobasidium pullulans]